MIEETREELIEKTALLEQQVNALRGSSQELGVLMAMGLTEKQATMLMTLVRRYPAVISRPTFHSIIYGNRSDGGPEPAIFGVWIHRIRLVLKREGCKGCIEAVWGSGYRADSDLVAWVLQLYKDQIPTGDKA